mgnify:FL=1|tara:strand:- start:4121 stop:4297 length:177 start_codon:yes stop_codon:yes gene_type:complete
MKNWGKYAFKTFVLAILVSLSGCADEEDSQIPWAKPASWEGTPAGMGNIKTPGAPPRY